MTCFATEALLLFLPWIRHGQWLLDTILRFLVCTHITRSVVIFRTKKKSRTTFFHSHDFRNQRTIGEDMQKTPRTHITAIVRPGKKRRCTQCMLLCGLWLVCCVCSTRMPEALRKKSALKISSRRQYLFPIIVKPKVVTGTYTMIEKRTSWKKARERLGTRVLASLACS